jgi:hypothetical protein
MSPVFELEGFGDWFQQPQQEEAASQLMFASLALTCARLGMEPEDLLDSLEREDQTDFTLMHMDNCAAAFADGGRTFGEIYLKKRGWKDAALNRAYIEALKNAPLQLLTILDVTETQLLVRNALSPDDDSVWVDAPSDFELRPGDLVATRILNMRGRVRFASGLFLFANEARDDIADFLTSARDAIVAERAKQDADFALPERLSEFLAIAPHLMLNYWLEDIALPWGSAGVGPAAIPATYWRVSYSLAESATDLDATAALAQIPGLQMTLPGRWRVPDLDVEPSPRSDLMLGEHAIVLTDGHLRFYAASGATRDRLRDVFGDLDARVFSLTPAIDEVAADDAVQDLARQSARHANG